MARDLAHTVDAISQTARRTSVFARTTIGTTLVVIVVHVTALAVGAGRQSTPPAAWLLLTVSDGVLLAG